ncbi:MAG TPA: transporter substrate-binding domain-containing protein, partial [Spirochaetota bacterium]|nr:transporter substrate-binding domain-containing protein [Spirochaetota bacterium]
GFSTEIVKEVFKEAKLDYEIRCMNWEGAQNISLTKPNVLIYSIGRNPEREQKYKWVGKITNLVIYFYKLKENSNVSIKDLSDAMKYKIGVVSGDFRESFLQKRDFPNLLHHTNDSVNIKKLFSKNIDILPNEELSMIFTVKKEGFDPKQVEKVFLIKDLETELFMAFSLQTSDETVKKCQDAYTKIKQSNFIKNLTERYLK